jgi:hypothetical protein
MKIATLADICVVQPPACRSIIKTNTARLTSKREVGTYAENDPIQRTNYRSITVYVSDSLKSVNSRGTLKL